MKESVKNTCIINVAIEYSDSGTGVSAEITLSAKEITLLLTSLADLIKVRQKRCIA